MKQYNFKLLLSLFCTLFFLHGNAQNISIGARGGILLANLEFTPRESGDPSYKDIIVPQGALFVEIGIGNFFAIQPEIMYGTHGGKYNESLSSTEFGVTVSSTADVNIKINTIEIPLLAKVKLGPDAVKFHILAGPSFGFGLNGSWLSTGRYTITGPGVNSSNNYDHTSNAVFVKDGYTEADVKENEFAVSKTNLNLHLGAGVNFKVGNLSFFLDGRYILGMSDLIPDYKDAAADEKYEGKSTRIGISAGVMFTLGGDDF